MWVILRASICARHSCVTANSRIRWCEVFVLCFCGFLCVGWVLQRTWCWEFVRLNVFLITVHQSDNTFHCWCSVEMTNGFSIARVPQCASYCLLLVIRSQPRPYRSCLHTTTLKFVLTASTPEILLKGQCETLLRTITVRCSENQCVQVKVWDRYDVSLLFLGATGVPKARQSNYLSTVEACRF